MTFLSLSLLFTSCAQDETRDNVMPTEKKMTTDASSARLMGTTVTLIKEAVPNSPQVLNSGESITMEANGISYRLTMQIDHNLVLYKTNAGHNTVLWQSNTYNALLGNPSQLIAQNDGNMVIYNNGIPLWSANKSVNYHVADPHIKLQLFSRTGPFIPSGHRIKLVLSGNGQNITDVFQVDF